MKRSPTIDAGATAFILASLLLPSIAWAAEYATFESFYHQSTQTGWYLAAAFAVIAGVLVLIVAPPAGAAVTVMGSWIGGLFGYSGVAATNFGLALLGGGAVAAGGMGIPGGVAVLTAVFSFTTDIVLDYATSSVVESYQYATFAEASQKMTTLPLPRNREGPGSYEKAMKILDGVNQKEALSGIANRAVVLKAITEMNSPGAVKLTQEEAARHESMLSLLYFVANDYKAAKVHANTAFSAAKAAKVTRTLPAFILAAASLYDDKVDFKNSIELFRYSIHGEPDNPLAPLLFSVFLDRMMFRLNDGAITPRQFNDVTSVAEWPPLGELWIPITVVNLSRYVTLLKKEQQIISSLVLVGSSNASIRDSEKTLVRVRQSFRDYELLLERAQFLSGALSNPLAPSDPASTKQLRDLRLLVTKYSGDRARLGNLVITLQARQAEYRLMSTQISALAGYMKGLEFALQKIRSLAGSSNASMSDSQKTLANGVASLREYEVLLDRAQLVAAALSSPTTLPDEKSSEDVRAIKADLKRYIDDLPEVRQMVAGLGVRQTELLAKQMAGSAQTIAQGQLTEASRAQENAAKAERLAAAKAKKQGIAIWSGIALLALFIGFVGGRRFSGRAE